MNRDDDQSDEAPAELEAVKLVSADSSRRAQTQRMFLRYKSKQYAHLAQNSVPPRLLALGTTLEPILDLNRRVLAHRAGPARVGTKSSIDNCIKADGEICSNFEFLLFGIWLVIDGKPGLAITPGLAADEETLLKTVAAAAAAVWRNEGLASSKVSSHQKLTNKGPGWITATKMRDRWHMMYDQELDQAMFRSRLKSAKRYLRAYLAQLKRPPTDTAIIEPKLLKVKSPHLARVLAAMTPAAKP